MLVIGMAGGVASGKSLVTLCLEHFGARVIDGDREGHRVLRQPDIMQQIVARWGADLLVDDAIDRSRLARIVFDSSPAGLQNLEELERITHPAIGQSILSQLEMLRQDEAVPAVVLDAPVMFKAGWDRMCDRIVFVDAPRDIRQQRASSRGWSEDELDKREFRQTPVDLKRARATDVIDNSGSKEKTYLATARMWRSWGFLLPVSLESPASLFST